MLVTSGQILWFRGKLDKGAALGLTKAGICSRGLTQGEVRGRVEHRYGMMINGRREWDNKN